jgi:hypothetical protein
VNLVFDGRAVDGGRDWHGSESTVPYPWPSNLSDVGRRRIVELSTEDEPPLRTMTNRVQERMRLSSMSAVTDLLSCRGLGCGSLVWCQKARTRRVRVKLGSKASAEVSGLLFGGNERLTHTDWREPTSGLEPL